MAFAILYEGLKLACLSSFRSGCIWITLGETVNLGKGSVYFLADSVDYRHVRQFLPSADIVGFAGLSPF